MEKDKLEIAANKYEEESIYGGMEALYDTKYAFKQGAEWLQSQPLADRLSETEKEKIIAMYNQAVGDTKGYYSDTWDAAYAVIEFCEQIFGKEMFEPKNNNI